MSDQSISTVIDVPPPVAAPDGGVDRRHADWPVVTIIEPRSGWRLIDWREVLRFQDLFLFLVWKDVKIRYAQSAIGIGWAVIQPLFTMLIFTVVFGNLAKLPSDGVPHTLFYLTALVPWTYFSNALTGATVSLVNQAQVISKIYFPRILLPISSVMARLVDFGIGMLLLFGLMAWHGTAPASEIILLPVLIGLMMMTAAGIGLWLTALAIQYRDVKHAVPFFVQLLMYASPVVYSVSMIPKPWQLVYALNPMVAVIEGFRAALLGSRPMPWDFLAMGSLTALALIISGMLYFHRRERVFADVA